MTNQNQQKNYPKDERIQNNVLMGFWHNWPAQPNSGQQGGEPATMSITEVHRNYNVIAVAFMNTTGNTDPIPSFIPFGCTDKEFIKQINALHEQKRVVLLSLGGANANIKMHKGQEEALSKRIIELSDKYGFDGLDINLHQTEIDAADNSHVIPEALKLVKNHYKTKEKNFIITISSEFPNLRESGKYIPYIKSLEGYYDFIAPQFYNQGSDGILGDEGEWIPQNDDTKKEDFLYHLTKSIVTGTKGYIKIPHDKFIMGLPSNVDTANSGYIADPLIIRDVFNKLEIEEIYIRGLATWSINWDNGKSKDGEKYNWRFASDYGYLTEISVSQNKGRNLDPVISQFIEIPIKGEKYSLVGRLTSNNPEDHSKTDHLNKNNISSGAIYRIVVFDKDGKYVTQKVLTQGQQPEDIQGLTSGETYKFVAYSYNNKTTPPEVKESDNITSGLKISGEGDNNFSYSYSEKKVLKALISSEDIDINMKPLYRTLEVIINSEVGNISSISGEISPNHIEDTINLANGTIAYGPSTNEKSIVFSGVNTSTVTGAPVVFNLPTDQMATFKISSITIDGKINTDLEYPFKIDAGQSYTLNLNIKEAFRISDISYTKMFTMALSTSGDIYVAGNNHRFSMGNTIEENKNITSFKLCTDLFEKGKKYKAILAAGYSTAYAVSKEGRLYVAGYSWLGQLGLGLKNGEVQKVFREVLTDGKTGNSFNVEHIWGGEYHTFIKTTDSKIYAAGAHDNLQAGLGYPASGGQVTIFTKIEPTLFNDETVVKITTGERTTMALTSIGNVYYAGRNGASYGSLGGVSDTNMFTKFPASLPPFNQKIKEIYSGAWHNFVLTESGELWAAGRNGEGQLGINSRSHAPKWVRVTNVPSPIDDISAGGFHTYLLSNGKLYSTGLNDTGQLGLGDTKLRQVFTALSIRQPVDTEKLYHGPNNDCRHTYMKGLDGRFYNVGWNAWGQLSNGTTINNVTFQQFYH